MIRTSLIQWKSIVCFIALEAKKMNGLLYLPLDNVCSIRVVCDEQIVVCNLHHTPHVPDQSRNTNNISKTHGPKP